MLSSAALGDDSQCFRPRVTDERWERAEMGPPLSSEEVHVWRVGLDRGDREIETFRRLLDPREQQRSDAMVFRHHGDRLTIAHGALRLILGSYLSIDPREVRYAYGQNQKPSLAATHGTQGPRFNLSHSDNLALIAVARGRELGIDLEKLRTTIDVDRVAKRFFSPREMMSLGGGSIAKRREAFFSTWTRKEAYLKARGDGLRYPLEAFSVDVDPAGNPILARNSRNPEDVGRWTFRTLALSASFFGTLVVEGFGWSQRCFDWGPDHLGRAERRN